MAQIHEIASSICLKWSEAEAEGKWIKQEKVQTYDTRHQIMAPDHAILYEKCLETCNLSKKS